MKINKDACFFVAALFRCTFPSLLALSAVFLGVASAQAERTDWVASSGSWFTPSNWNPNLPTSGSLAYISNGGNAAINAGQALADSLFLGTPGVGSVNQSGGSLSLGGSLVLGESAGFSGTYRLSGTGQLTATATIVNAGGFRQDGGTHNANHVHVRGDGLPYYQMNAGDLNVSGYLMIGGYTHDTGTFTQTGGTVNVAGRVGLGSGPASYVLQDGTLNAQELGVSGSGVFRQSGGTAVANWLRVESGGRYEYTHGNLAIGGLTISGVLDLAGKTVTVPATDGAVLDFRSIAPGTVLNAQNAAFVAGPNTLTIVTPGLDPSSIIPFATTGLVYTVGGPLTIPAGMDLKVSHVDTDETIDFNDHFTCNGSFRIMGDNYGRGINLNDGVEIAQGAIVDIGKGRLTVNDQVSGIDSGQLRAANGGGLWIGKAANATFTQAGGTVAVDQIWVGNTGFSSSYQMQRGAISFGTLWVGRYGMASFVQAAGSITGTTLVVGKNSGVSDTSPTCTYEMRTGSSLTTASTLLGDAGKSRFIQNGGTHTTDSLVLGYNGYSADHNRYDLNSGQLTAGSERVWIGNFYQAGGTHTVTGELLQDGGHFTLSGGSLSAGRLTINAGTFSQDGTSSVVTGPLTIGASHTGRYELATGTLQASSVTIAPGRGTTGTFAQSGGTTTVAGSIHVGQGAGGSGTYSLGRGRLDAGELHVGEDGAGTFAITDWLAQVNVSGALTFGSDSTFTAVSRNALRLSGTALDIRNTDSNDLAGLFNVALYVEGGPGVITTLEVAGRDVGPGLGGMTSGNFALARLQVGEPGRIGYADLVDLFDNQTS